MTTLNSKYNIFLYLFDNNNRRVRLFPGGADGSGGSRARVEAPVLSQMSDDAAGGAHDGGAPSKRIHGSGRQTGSPVPEEQPAAVLGRLQLALNGWIGLRAGP